MADTSTTNLNLTKIEVAGSDDTWGEKLNANQDTLDALFDAGPVLKLSKGGTGASTASGARSNLGLGSLATQAADAVAITGGSIAGITDLAVADGGTGASNAAGARSNLGLGTAATKDVGTAANQIPQLDADGKLPAVDGSALTGINSVPSGVVLPFAGSAAPTGYLFCYGQAINRTTYATLFAAIGTTYGTGDGSTTFNVPDMRGRVPAGQDDMGGTSADRLTGVTGSVNGDTLGAAGGAETHTLTVNELAAHQHALLADASGSGQNISASNYVQKAHNYTTNDDYIMRGDTTAATLGLSGSQGSGAAHNNVQPTIILNYIIKT